MADYYPVLKRAISSLPPGSGEARRAVYEKARSALLRQLNSYNPPLSPADITEQRLALEDCIRRVEAEVAEAAFGLAPQPQPAPPRPAVRPETPPHSAPSPAVHHEAPPPAARPAAPAEVPAVVPEARREPPPVRAPARPAPRPAPRQQPPIVAPVRQEAEAVPPPEPAAPGEPPHAAGESRISAGVNALSKTLRQAGTLGQASSTAVRAARQAIEDEPPERPAAPERVEPGFAERKDAAEAAAPSEPAPAGPSSATAENGAPSVEAVAMPWIGQEAPKRRFGRAALLAAVGALVLVVAAVAFAFRADIASLVGGGEQTASAVGDNAPDAALAPKIPDRLPTDGGDIAEPVAPDAHSVQIETVKPANIDPDLPPQPMVGAPAAPAEAARNAASPAQEPATVAEAQPAAPAAPAEAFAPTSTAPAAPAAGAAASAPSENAAAQQSVLVAQKAILYEEPIPGSPGTKLEGQVLWSFVTEPPLPGEKPVPQIRAQIQIPDLKLGLRLSIHKNSDDALPASHIVELNFDVPPSFPGKSIDTTPGMIAKQTEEARGDPLLGAVAKVSDNFYWLALSGVDADVARNVDLLKSREWFDIPIRYTNRRRAILTFEKGVQGDKAMEAAFAAWGQ